VITQLHKRVRADRFLNDVRANQKRRRNYGRYVYLAAVLGVFLYLTSLFVGPYLWLRAEGLVISDHVVIASPYAVQVTRVLVQPGQRVRRGDLLVKAHSPEVIEALATLTTRAAETSGRQAEIAFKYEVANALVRNADERLAEAEAQLKKVQASHSIGFVSDTFIASVSKDRYAAMQEKVSREAERKAAIDQLERLQESQAEVKQTLDDLRAIYNNGAIVASADGIVGPKIAVQGDVVKPGDQLMQVYVGPKYALVYLDTGTLYKTEVGDRAEVADGFNNTGGTVEEILPLTVPLPPEFQKAFRPPTRGQIVKIKLDDERPFPMATKVVVTGDNFVSGNGRIAQTALYQALERFIRMVKRGFTPTVAVADRVGS
jgi:multidrug resistance efflux pump